MFILKTGKREMPASHFRRQSQVWEKKPTKREEGDKSEKANKQRSRQLLAGGRGRKGSNVVTVDWCFMGALKDQSGNNQKVKNKARLKMWMGGTETRVRGFTQVFHDIIPRVWEWGEVMWYGRKKGGKIGGWSGQDLHLSKGNKQKTS